MYSVSRKNCEKTAPVAIRALKFDPASVRSRKMRSGNRGALERASIRKNETIRTPEAAKRPMVAGVPPPVLSGASHPIDEQHQPGGDRRRTSEVEVPIGQI